MRLVKGVAELARAREAVAVAAVPQGMVSAVALAMAGPVPGALEPVELALKVEAQALLRAELVVRRRAGALAAHREAAPAMRGQVTLAAAQEAPEAGRSRRRTCWR